MDGLAASLARGPGDPEGERPGPPSHFLGRDRALLSLLVAVPSPRETAWQLRAQDPGAWPESVRNKLSHPIQKPFRELRPRQER